MKSTLYVLAGALLLTSCAELEKEKLPVVTTSGPNSVMERQTILITATTSEVSDTSYTFESADPSIATVDESGAVSGIVAGETKIKVRGNDSNAEALHPVVVLDPLAGLDGGIVPASQIPFYLSWSDSAHADKSAVPFNYPPTTGTACARCHSTDGYIDYLGGDGSPAGTVEKPGKLQQTITCNACHNSAASALTEVTFPSGVTVTGLGPEARCMVCHQGRASGKDVDAAITTAAVPTEDTLSPALTFLNIHYFPAAATLFAGQVMGGYQYPGDVYDYRFRHVAQLDKCNECHDPHSLQVRFDQCVTCHAGVTDITQAHNIRQIASRNQDYDGDGNLTEGIFFEIAGLQEQLLAAIQRYSSEKGEPACYNRAGHPYWFKDTDGDGTCSAAESVATNPYKAWSPRTYKAAYNYHLSRVDPGNFAHNAKYTIQLLHDSVKEMNAGLTAPFDTTRLVREDPGHFNGAGEPTRHWDEDETVSASCSRCHGASDGYRFFVQYGVGQALLEKPNGLDCATCHDDPGKSTVAFNPGKTYLPDGKTVNLTENDDLCANCHIGRASKATVDANIAAAGAGAPKYANVHYIPAAGTHSGTTAKIGYEYTGKTYAGRMTHTGGTNCVSCHVPGLSNHTFRIADVWGARCQTCHADSTGPDQIRMGNRTADYDGDGNVTEPLKAELDGMAERLFQAMRVATSNGICFNKNFYIDTNGNGTCDTGETTSFTAFTPALVKAAHNYNFSRKDSAPYAHNFTYMGQLLFDSVEDLQTGVAPTNMTRP